MAKLPKIEHVKFVRRAGKVYAYFNTGAKQNGKPIYERLPSLADPGFWPRYGALKAGRTKRSAPAATVASLANEYLVSAEFREKAENTQTLYRKMIDKIVAAFGKFPIDDLQPADVRLVLDASGWGAGNHNMVLATIGVIYTWARKRGKASIEPVKDIDRMKGGRHEPWPDDVLEAALQADDSTVRLAVHLMYFTGLRINDALSLRWGDIRGDAFHITPTKTRRFDKRLHIPLAAELRDELARTPRTALTILHGLNDRRLRELLQAFTRGLGVETVPHGLRKNAVQALLLAGCTVAEVAAITGQTYQVVEHYAARVDNRKLGQAAILKLDIKRAGTEWERETPRENGGKNG
jgi:integrase